MTIGLRELNPDLNCSMGSPPLWNAMTICHTERPFPFGTFISFLSRDVLTGAVEGKLGSAA